MARGAVAPGQASSAQQLASGIKSARDIMRKDKGLSGDLDRLPMLTWIMFLKFLDDMEQVREAEAAMAGKPFRPAVEPPYRWRDWAADPGGIKGDELIAFINQDEAVRPDGSRGPGLFAYLRALQGSDGGDRRDVIASVFRGTVNRMINGYLLRDVINKVNAINFRSSDEIHTLGALYESMLKEMRDAAGDSGEFYTPRPVVRFIVTAIDPQLGETILDPAAGTGGFLVSAFEHLQKQCRTVEDHERLQRGTLLGIEAKPLPYLLGQMNLLLHGLEYPEIDPGNALRFPLREIGDKERVDIIMTNPPFGGEEEPGIRGNFPEDKQTSETALLFLQLVMRKLRRPVGGYKGGRCGIVVPNGVLFSTGVCARIRKELLEEFNLHTIVRLPAGVFSPYAGIPTNILFFDRSGPTEQIWYYEQPKREVGGNYSKSRPMRYEEFAECLTWWGNRTENEHAWKVSVSDIVESGYSLDRRNPSARENLEHRSPHMLLQDTIVKEKEILSTLEGLHTLLERHSGIPSAGAWRDVRIGDILAYLDERIELDDMTEYTTITVKRRHGGLEARETLFGHQIETKKQFRLVPGAFIISRVQCWHQAWAIVPANVPANMIASTNYDQFAISAEVDRRFFWWLSQSPAFTEAVRSSAAGVVIEKMVFNREAWLKKTISLPPIEEQRQMADVQAKFEGLKRLRTESDAKLDALLPSLLDKAFKGEL